MIKRIAILLLLAASVIPAAAVTNTNLIVIARGVMVDTNGVLLLPAAADFRASNDIASAAAALVVSNTAGAALSRADGVVTGVVTNAVGWVGNAAGLTNGPWWLWSTYAPTSSTAGASNWTIAVNTTNIFLCATNSWLGRGTNWLRIQGVLF